MDMGQFTNQVVVVTGATGGLGSAVVHAFLSEGAMVWGILGPSSPSRIADPNFATVAADLTVPAEAELAVRKVIETSGKIDVLLHLTGGFAGGKPVAETDDAAWNRMLDLNLHTAIHMARAVLPHMLQAGKGRIVAIGSRTGVEPAAGLSAYGVSKAALIALIRTIAAEVRNSGVTANILLPSVIDTPANRAASPAADFSKWVQPESIARLLLFLASDDAADINGAVIPIYGRV
jgi:NAD(P)-dependent dehydrogenase (short-subunit alcohol dehydrogenase family)